MFCNGFWLEVMREALQVHAVRALFRAYPLLQLLHLAAPFLGHAVPVVGVPLVHLHLLAERTNVE